MECGEGGDKTLPNELTKGKGGRMRARFERAARERNRERERERWRDVHSSSAAWVTQIFEICCQAAIAAGGRCGL